MQALEWLLLCIAVLSTVCEAQTQPEQTCSTYSVRKNWLVIPLRQTLCSETDNTR
jgi:hypothetical protein